MFQWQPPLLELIEVLGPGCEEDGDGSFRQRTPTPHPIGEGWTCQPIAQKGRGLASGMDRGDKPSAQIDHVLSRRLKMPAPR